MAFEDLPFEISDEEPLYVLSLAPREASHAVARWQQHHSNIKLVPLSTSDIVNAITEASEGHTTNVVVTSLSPQFETIDHLFSEYNTVYLSNAFGMKGSTKNNAVVLYDANLPFYSDAFWSSVKASMDRSKPTLIIATKRELDDRAPYARFIASKLGLDTVHYQNTPAVWRNANFINADNLITPGYPNQSTFISQADLYVKQAKSNRYQVVCLSEGCLKYFPYPRRVLWDHQEILGRTDDGMHQVTIPDTADRSNHYILAPMGSEEASLALRVGYELTKQGYRFDGFTFHPSQYYGATYDLGRGEIYFDDWAIMFDRYLAGAIDIIVPDEAPIQTLEVLLALGVSLGLLLSIAGPARWLGVGALFYLCVFFTDLVRLPLAHYQTMVVTPAMLTGLFVLAMTPAMKKRTLASLVLASVGIYYGSAFMLLPMDILVGSVLATMGLLSMAKLLFGILRYTTGLKNPRSVSSLGAKCKNTLPWTSPKLTGYLITRPRVSGLLLPGGRDREWILRSNHLDEREQSQAGIFESRRVTKKSLRSDVQKSYVEAKDRLSGTQIQFWLQPFVEADLYGVASSHDLTRPGCMRIEYGQHQDVTDGNAVKTALMERWAKPGKAFAAWQKDLFRTLQDIEAREGHPVIVEFAAKGKKATILQVRHQRHTGKWDAAEMSTWLDCPGAFKPAETMSLTDFGKNVLFHLYRESCLVDGNVVLRKAVKGKCALDVSLCERAFNDLISLRKTGRHLLLPVSRLMVKLEQALINLPLESLADKKLKNDGRALFERIHGYLLEHQLILAQDMDAGSHFVGMDKNGEAIPSPSTRDLMHALMSLSVVMVHECAAYKRVPGWERATIEMIDDGETPSEDSPTTLADADAETILVSGDFEGPTVSWTDFMALPDEEKHHHVIDASSIPGVGIASALKAKAIILDHASELSHIAISCRSTGTPLKTRGHEVRD